MLRRLNVRTRLVGVIAVPLALLLAVALPEGLERRSRAGEAQQAVAVTAGMDGVAAATDAIQAERTLAAAWRAGAAGQVERALAAQRARTDAAVDAALGALVRLAHEHPALRAPADVAGAELGRLEDVRAGTDAAESLVPWQDPYAPAIDALLEVQETAASVASDLGVGEGLTAVALLAHAKEAAAAQALHLAAAATWGGLRADQAGLLTDLRADEAAYRTAYLSTSPTRSRGARRGELLTTAVTAAGRRVDGVIAGGAVPDLATALRMSEAGQAALRDVEADRAAAARAAAADVGAASTRASRWYLALAGSGLLAALALALAAARSITRPLRELTDAADLLAEDRLPKLVDALRNPVDDDEHYLSAAMEPIPVGSDDELGHLAQAFNAVQSVAVDVAAEQSALLKKGISDLYVNLARRNQALLDRQIQHLDELEREEQDTEVLEHLYLLDHLATRMRRNAESLLVLAGAESGPRRSKAAPVVDVVRAAVSEVEEYERVELGSVAGATLHGPAVSDVAHLVAELIENATQFSPPQSLVRIDGGLTGGSYHLVITDDGVGMRPDQIEQLNAVLRDPPVTGLALGRSLGCLVAARLAARHGIVVRLQAGVTGGVAATVVLPRHLLVDEPEELAAVPPAPEVLRTAPVPEPSMSMPSPPPATLAEALPRVDLDARLDELLARDGVGATPPPPAPRATPAEASSAAPTLGGLPRRVPGATAGSGPERPAAPPRRRDPDEVRAQLSRYRSGFAAGRGGKDPVDEERA